MAKQLQAPFLDVFNPATGEQLARVASPTAEACALALERARRAQPAWAARGLAERITIVRGFRDRLVEQAESVCEIITRENGKVLQEAFQMEVFPIIDLATYFCDRAESILAPRRIPLHLLKHRRSMLHYRPRGVVLVIAPWNFPFAIPFGEVIMALLAGNTVIVKPASLTPLACLEGLEIFRQAGLDDDVLQVLPCSGRVASEMIEMGVDYVNFTGSTAIGEQVAALCGRHLTPCTMELGGKDPAIVLPDADLDLVEGSLVWGAFANAGQVCASIERVYVHETIYEEVVDRVVARVARMQVGDPLADGTDLGPMTDAEQLAVVERHVADAVAKGARVLSGGQGLPGPGQFYPPTLLVDVSDDMLVVREETFGPVLPIMRYRDVEDAIRRANDSAYGLDAYVYGSHRKRALAVAERLEVGTVMINETLITHACPETPWGGVKGSGLGRVHSDDGLRDLCVTHHINDELLPSVAWSPFWPPYSHRMYRALIGAARALDHSQLGSRAGGVWNLVTNAVRLARERRAA